MTDTALGSYLKAGVASRRGYEQIAANHMRAALSAVDWNKRKCALQEDNWFVYLDDSLDWMVVYVDEQVDNGKSTGRIVISEATWETLHHDPGAMDDFVDEMKAGGSGMKFVVTDKGRYNTAVRNQAKAEGTDVTKGKDALTQLGDKATALVMQAASLNAKPTLVQQQSFAVRYAAMLNDYAAIEDRLRLIRAQIELAGAALYDITLDG